MPAPRIAAIHDLSCFGRCSLTIALPVLSAMGCQCCPLPTALLSAHTGISGFTFLDTTDEMRRISAHWSQLSLHFQAILELAAMNNRQKGMGYNAAQKLADEHRCVVLVRA